MEKQAFLTLAQLYQRHKKQTTTTLKHETNKQKNTFLPCSKTTRFHKFSEFFNIQLFYRNCCALLKTLLNSVFRRTQLFKSTARRTHFTHVKKHLFQKKGIIFGLGTFRANHYFYSFSRFSLFWSKNFFGQNR